MLFKFICKLNFVFFLLLSSAANSVDYDLTKLYANGMPYDPGLEFWMSIPPGGGKSIAITQGGETRLYIRHTNVWDQLSDEIDTVVVYRSAIYEAITGQNGSSMAELKHFALKMKEKNIKIAIELSGLQSQYAIQGPVVTAENTFNSDYNNVLKKFTDPVSVGGAGGYIDYLIFDGPLRRYLYSGLGHNTTQENFSEPAEALALVMEKWRTIFPEIEFVLLSNFSNWGWDGVYARNTHGLSPMGYGEYKTALDAAITKAQENNLTFYSIVADYAYDAFVNEGSSDQWSLIENLDYKARLKNLRDYVVNVKGLKFNVITNSYRGSSDGNYPFRVESFNYIYELYQLGIIPSAVVMQSWEAYPSKWLQENTFGSMTWTTRLALFRVRYGIDLYPGY